MLTPLLRDRAMMVCQRHFDNHRRSAARNDAAPLRYGANICRSWGDGRTDVGQRHAEAGSVPPTVVWEQSGICGVHQSVPAGLGPVDRTRGGVVVPHSPAVRVVAARRNTSWIVDVGADGSPGRRPPCERMSPSHKIIVQTIGAQLLWPIP